MSMEGEDTVLLNASDNAILEAKTAYILDPENLRLFDKYIQLLIKNNDINTAEELIASSSILKKECIEAYIVHAHLLYKIKKYNEADMMFDDLILKFPENQKLRMVYAQTLKKRRKLIKAYKIIQPIDSNSLDRKQLIIYDEIKKLISAIETKEGRPLNNTDDFSILSMKHAILHFKDSPKKRNNANQLGKVSLITGSLGPGGAERQLCLTAIHINEKKNLGKPISGQKINKEVDVLINAWDLDGEKNFFLPLLKEHQVNLFQIKEMPSIPIEQLQIDSPDLLNLLNESPSQIRYGLNRLVQYFQTAKTDVAFIWQDGAILFAAVAALVAGVPHIVLNLRGYPPNLRPHLFKPEYYDLYKSLAEIPKVSFVTNTESTAKAYMEWLNIPYKKFTVIYNGISPKTNIKPEGEEETRWKQFESQTSDATQTIGGVFRFENDKRPIMVIRFIKRYLQKHANTRFILVGEGRLRKQAMELAKELGISTRILFVGLSQNVSYWLLKMEAMILMSLYEGLPNVLIEAQYMGVPVISTPAGGAAECFIEGETGYILSNANEPDLYEACEKVFTMVSQFKKDPNLKNKAISFAKEHFSIYGMIEKTVTTLSKTKI